MKRLLKKIMAFAFIALTVFALCGCGAKVECYYMSDSFGTSYRYRLVMPTSLRLSIENTAKVRGDGQKYTVNSYLGELANVRGLTYEGFFLEGYNTVYSLYLFVENDNSTGGGSGGDAPEFEWGFFNHKYTYKVASPYNDLYDEYNGTPAQGGLMYVLKNGYDYTVASKEDLPPLAEVFPAIASEDMTKLGLDFYWANSKIEAINGQTYGSGTSKYSYWEGKFDGQDRYFEYNYYVVNPLGWYVVILGIGIALVVILLIATRKSNRKPQMKPLTPVRTPYDTAPRVIYVVRRPGKPDIFGINGEPENPSETDEEKARRELEDIFMGRSDHDDSDDKQN
ncbi:MAG: hypothetical protein IJY70_01755 [Clostridia bacterium]|nr:hypothetical protein [Clostridia bacterium]